MGSNKKSQDKKKPEVNKELEGLDININSFGEIQSSFNIDKINEFLDANVADKKLMNDIKKEMNPPNEGKSNDKKSRK